MLVPEKEIIDQENIVNFLLQHSVVFEYLFRLSIKKNVTGREKWNIQTSQIIRILQWSLEEENVIDNKKKIKRYSRHNNKKTRLNTELKKIWRDKQKYCLPCSKIIKK